MTPNLFILAVPSYDRWIGIAVTPQDTQHVETRDPWMSDTDRVISVEFLEILSFSRQVGFIINTMHPKGRPLAYAL